MKKKTLLLAAVLLAVILLITVVSLATSSGLVNLLVRNALAHDLSIPEREWSGTTYENVPYSEISEAEYLNLYVPDDVENPPLLILVHGGGFVSNDCTSRQARLMYEYFRANGYACASVNYRLADEAIYPAAVEDVKAAVKFPRVNAERYGYDPDRFVLWGESAGGYLATMTAVCGEGEYNGVPFIGEDEAGDVSAQVNALVDFYGVIDMGKTGDDFAALGTPKWLLALTGGGGGGTRSDFTTVSFLGRPLSELKQDQLREIDPHTRINNALAERDLSVYIAHGSVDITVPKLQSERLAAAFSDVLGAENVVYKEQLNLKHADDRFYTDENLLPVKEFLNQLWNEGVIYG